MLQDSEFRSPSTLRSFDGAGGSCRCICRMSMRQALFFASCASRSPVRTTEIPFSGEETAGSITSGLLARSIRGSGQRSLPGAALPARPACSAASLASTRSRTVEPPSIFSKIVPGRECCLGGKRGTLYII